MKNFTCFFGVCLFFANVVGQTYTNVAQQQNVIFISNISFNFGGSGVGFFDFNNDGWDDITFVQENDSQVFYGNNNGFFQKLPSFIFSSGETKQVLWVDYDNDSDYDLFVSILNGPIKLFQNDGNFNFTDVSFQAGLSPVNAANYGVAFGDYDKDGFLDFYICRYVGNGNPLDITVVNNLYRNNGNGTFTNVTFQAGVADGIAPSFQAVWMDYDKDGWPDLYVINDRNMWGNSMYRNNGDGTFTDVTLQTNTEVFGQDPMTATVGDFDNDGDLDIYMTNTALFPGPDQKKGMLLVNNGDGTFREEAEAYRVDLDQYAWGATWVDFNNDTYQDLYVTTSRFSPVEPVVRSYLYVSNEAQVFIDSPAVFLNDHSARSFSVAKGDINNDGYADLVVSNVAPFRSFLWQNSGGQNNFIKITLEGTASNKMAIGSWIYVHAGGNRYTHYTMCGENFVSQNSQHHIFGLAQYETVDSVIVEYLSGITDKYYNLEVNQHYRFTEGETVRSRIIALGPLAFCEGGSVVLDAGDFVSYEWNDGDIQRFKTVQQAGDYFVTVESLTGSFLQSDTVSVQIVDLPLIQIDVKNISCAGAEDGQIELEVQTQASDYTIIWSNGMQSSVINGLPAGTYTYNYSDIFGCVASESATITDPFELNLQILTVNETDTAGGKILMVINGGAEPYTILLDGTEISTVVENLMASDYLLEVIDANGCSSVVPITIGKDTQTDTTLSLGYHSGVNFKVFPNPFENYLVIDGPLSEKFSIKIFGAAGNLVFEAENSQIIDLKHLVKGIYLVSLSQKEEVFEFRVIRN